MLKIKGADLSCDTGKLVMICHLWHYSSTNSFILARFIFLARKKRYFKYPKRIEDENITKYFMQQPKEPSHKCP